MSSLRGISAAGARLVLLGLLIAHAACATREPACTLQPTIVAASSGARVTFGGPRTIVALQGGRDAIALGPCGDAVTPLALHLRARLRTAQPTTILVTLVPLATGARPQSLAFPLRAQKPRMRHLWLPLSSLGDPREHVASLLIAAEPGPTVLEIHSADLVPLTFSALLRCQRDQLLRLRGTRELPYLLCLTLAVLAAFLPLALLTAAVRLLRRKAPAWRDATRLARALSLVCLAIWCLEGARVAMRLAREARQDVETFGGRTQGELRAELLGRDSYELARLIDQEVPLDAAVQIVPGERPTMHDYRVRDAVSPRAVIDSQWGSPVAAGVDYVAARDGCPSSQGFEQAARNDLGQTVARRTGVEKGPLSPRLDREDRRPAKTEVPRLLLALLLMVAAGDGVLRLVFRGAAGPRRLPRLAYAWLLGYGVATLSLHAAATVGLPPWPTALLPVLLFSVAGIYVPRAQAPASPAEPHRPADIGLLLIPLAVLLCLSVRAFVAPPRDWDEVRNYSFLAHIFHKVGPTADALAEFRRQFPQLQTHPIGVPCLEAFLAHAMGRWDGARVKAAMPLFFGAALVLVGDGIRRHGSRRHALVFVALAATGTAAVDMAPLGMTDVPLAAMFLAALLAVEQRGADAEGTSWLLLAGLCSALMCFTKREGMPLSLIVLLCAAARVIMGPRAALGRRALVLLGTIACASLPLASWWYVYRAQGFSDPVLNVHTLSPKSLRASIHLVPRIAAHVARDLLTDEGGGGPSWNALYVMLLALVGLAPARSLRTRAGWLALPLAAGIACYGLVTMVSPKADKHMETTLGRLLVHFYPLAVVLAGRAYASVWGRRRGGCYACAHEPTSGEEPQALVR